VEGVLYIVLGILVGEVIHYEKAEIVWSFLFEPLLDDLGT